MGPYEREAAWFAVHDALPPGWGVGPCEHDPGRHAWTVAAFAPVRRRGQVPVSVEGPGADEQAALRDLVEKLVPGRLSPSSRIRFRDRGRWPVAGAERSVARVMPMVAGPLSRSKRDPGGGPFASGLGDPR